jgi:hypothetical protein
VTGKVFFEVKNALSYCGRLKERRQEKSFAGWARAEQRFYAKKIILDFNLSTREQLPSLMPLFLIPKQRIK